MAEPTVFVVDDDSVIRDSLSWLFQTVNLKSEVFTSGQEFLDSHDPEQIGCLILDVRMPGMSGLEV